MFLMKSEVAPVKQKMDRGGGGGDVEKVLCIRTAAKAHNDTVQ